MDWIEYASAGLFFLLSHVIPVRPAVKGRIVALAGRGGFSAIYSALSILALSWLIVAAGRAPHVVLWPWAPWTNWVPLVAMLPVSLIAALAIGRPMPLSFGGARAEAYDPARPGITGWVRHPLLAGLAIWSAAHLVPNGDLAHVIMFGALAGFALLGMRMIDRRKRREMGQEAWARLADVRPDLRPGPATLVRLALGVVLYLGLLHLHAPVIGIDPLQ